MILDMIILTEIPLERRRYMYQVALKKYKRALSRKETTFSTCLGICFFFKREFGIYDMYLLGELISLAPEIMWKDSAYWFAPGELSQRIEILEKAIEMCEAKLNYAKYVKNQKKQNHDTV